MTVSVVRAGVDTWVDETKPQRNYHRGRQLRVRKDKAEALVRIKSPVPRGANVVSAKLVLTTAVNHSGGTVTLSAQRADRGYSVASIRWANKPGVIGTVASVTKAGVARGNVWEIDVTTHVQAIADGQANHGWVLRSSNTSELRLDSFNASGDRPRLVVEWTTAPDTPTLLKPSDGVIAVAKPIVSCDYTDTAGSTDLTAIQVQTNSADSWGAPAWDSGAVAVDVPQLNLALTSFPGFAAGVLTYWRVRVKDGDGLWSGWSDAAAVTLAGKAALTITNPGVGGTVSDFTPTIVWTFGATQSHFQVFIADAARPGVRIFDSGKIADPDTSYEIPRKVLRDGRSYIVYVRAWDTLEREATAGVPTFANASRTFQVVYSAGVSPVGSLDAAQAGQAPWVDLTFTRSEAPDSFTILRDGEAVETGVEPGEVIVSGTTYRWRDYSVRPEVEHTYQVKCEVNGVLSSGGPTDTITTRPEGVWIADPTTGQEVVLGGREITGAAVDDADVYSSLGSTDVVRTIMGLNGLSGAVSDGLIRDRDWATWHELEETLYDFKGRPTETFRLCWADMNIPVILGDVAVIPHPQTIRGQVLKAATFSWWQTTEFPFEESF